MTRSVQQTLTAAMEQQCAGRLDQAENLCRQAVTLEPDNAEARMRLGIVLHEQGRIDGAVDALQRAVAMNPNSPVALLALGNSYSLKQRFDDAEACYRKALGIAPNSAEGWANLGSVLLRKSDMDEVVACAKKALSIQHDLPTAYAVMGGALQQLGQYDQSIEQYRKAISLRSDIVGFYNDLAVSLRMMRRYDEAVAELDKALALRPDSPKLWSNRARILLDQHRNAEAEASARRALEISPDLLEAHINLAKSQLDLGRLEEGMAAARRAVQINPALPEAHYLLGNLLKEDGQISAAIEQFGRVLEQRPDEAMIHSDKIYCMEFDPACDAHRLLAEQRLWNRRHAEPLKKYIRAHENDRSTDRRLRVGYVSPFFCGQAGSYFVVPLLEAHEREHFEFHCYSDVAREDRVTQRLKRCGYAWHATSEWSDEQLAEQIRRDRIDIVIDLAMHLAQNRATMLARKPAPIQVSWLAYPGGMGLDAIDYRISDPWIDPPGMDESCYHERTIRLPQTWVCYNPLEEVEQAPPRQAGPICFGSLNNPCKLNEPLLRSWATVMQAVDGSRLLVQAIGRGQRRRIAELFGSMSISPHRLQFVPRVPRPQYLRLYDRIDIFLDPVPFNGTTTTCDALWMGVPVISLLGKTAAGRTGKSILENVGLSELVANDADQFVRIATSLARDLPRLTELRRTLRQRICRSPVMDAPRFAREMEMAYRQIWKSWCAA